MRSLGKQTVRYTATTTDVITGITATTTDAVETRVVYVDGRGSHFINYLTGKRKVSYAGGSLGEKDYKFHFTHDARLHRDPSKPLDSSFVHPALLTALKEAGHGQN